MLHQKPIIFGVILTLFFTGCSAENNILSYSGDSILSVNALLDDPVYDQTISITGRIESMALEEDTIILGEVDARLRIVLDARLSKEDLENLRIGDSLMLIGTLQQGFLFGDPTFIAKNIRVIEAATIVSDSTEADR